MITLIPYSPQWADEWNALVAESRNGTFLLDRRFMDYHSDRFCDASLLFADNRQHIIAVLPANYEPASATVWSHQGLTYGGLITSRRMLTSQILEAMTLACQHFAAMGATRLAYRPTPYIYYNAPAQEDLYFLFSHGATLAARMLSQTIYLPDAIPLNTLRRRCMRKSVTAGNQVEEAHDVTLFWHLLNRNLQERHGVRPVHSIDELHLLMSRWPDRIRLFVVKNSGGETIAGTVVFDCGRVVHTQYIAANDKGKRTGALDQLFDQLICRTFADRQYFDFGVSTEKGGAVLNEGLTLQKESFGGRGVCYDTWQLNLFEFSQSNKM